MVLLRKLLPQASRARPGAGSDPAYADGEVVDAIRAATRPGAGSDPAYADRHDPPKTEFKPCQAKNISLAELAEALKETPFMGGDRASRDETPPVKLNRTAAAPPSSATEIISRNTPPPSPTRQMPQNTDPKNAKIPPTHHPNP